MADKKRGLVKYLVISWVLFFLALLGMGAILSVKIKEINRFIATPLQNGRDGQNALNLYELWLEEGNTGTLNDFLGVLKGDDGKDGEDGVTTIVYVREPSSPGAKGDKGDSPTPEEIAAAVEAYFVLNPPQAGPAGREIELCLVKGTGELGQRYVGTKACLPIEE